MSLHPPQRPAHLDLSPPSTAMSYESFKPKFPLDPFSASRTGSNARSEKSNSTKTDGGPFRPPWTVDVDRLPTLPFLRAERRVVLVVGSPSPSHLVPLLTSPHLTSSLLIIASHRPPSISPSTTEPYIRILHLRSPVAVLDSGATRLVQILEWAERTARIWRRHPGERVEVILEEDVDLENGGTAPKRDPRRFSKTGALLRSSMLSNSGRSGSTIFGSNASSSPAESRSSLVFSSPSSSSTSLPKQMSFNLRSLALKQRRENTLPTLPPIARSRSQPEEGSLDSQPLAAQQHRRTSVYKQQGQQALPPTDPTQRPFDAVFHFADATMSEKALLKQMILITTLARPYVMAMEEPVFGSSQPVAQEDSTERPSVAKKGLVRRLSMLRGSSSSPNILAQRNGSERSSTTVSSSIPSSATSPNSSSCSSPDSRASSRLSNSHIPPPPTPPLAQALHALTPLQAHANALAARRPGRIVHLLPSTIGGAAVPVTVPSRPQSTVLSGLSTAQTHVNVNGQIQTRARSPHPHHLPSAGLVSGSTSPEIPTSSSSTSASSVSSPGKGGGSIYSACRDEMVSSSSSATSMSSVGGGSEYCTSGSTSPTSQSLSPGRSLSYAQAQVQAQVQARLARGIEAFLLSYLFGGGGMGGMGGGGTKGFGAFGMAIGISSVGGEGGAVETRPFVLPAMTLAETIDVPEEYIQSENGASQTKPWTLSELILSGALDWFPVDEHVAKERLEHVRLQAAVVRKVKEAEAMSEIAKGKRKEAVGVGVHGSVGVGVGVGMGYGWFGRDAWMERRAWVSGVGDVKVRLGRGKTEGGRNRGFTGALPTPPSEGSLPTSPTSQPMPVPTPITSPTPTSTPTPTIVVVGDDGAAKRSCEEPSVEERSFSSSGGLPTPPASEEGEGRKVGVRKSVEVGVNQKGQQGQQGRGREQQLRHKPSKWKFWRIGHGAKQAHV